MFYNYLQVLRNSLPQNRIWKVFAEQPYREIYEIVFRKTTIGRFTRNFLRKINQLIPKIHINN